MTPSLNVLNDLASIMESVVIDYLGEAKGEILNLVAKLESDEAYAIEGRWAVVQELSEILVLYRANNKFEASRRFGLLSRRLWTDFLVSSQQSSGELLFNVKPIQSNSGAVIYYSADEVAREEGFEDDEELQQFETYIISQIDKEPSLDGVDYSEMRDEIIWGRCYDMAPEDRAIAKRIADGWLKEKASRSEILGNPAIGTQQTLDSALNVEDQTAADWVLEQVQHLSLEERKKVRVTVTLPPK